MMSIYLDYLDNDERSLMIETEIRNNELDKLNTLYEMECLRFSQLEKEIECKVFTESGTYDDLTYLIQEAAAESVETKKNILQRIIDAIRNFFNRLSGKSNEIASANVDPEEMVSVPGDLEEKSSIIMNAMNKMKTGATKLAQGDITGAFEFMSAAAAPVAVLTIGGGAVYKQIKAREAKKISSDMDNAKGFFNQIWDKVSSKISSTNDGAKLDETKKCFNPIQKLLDGVDSIFNAIKNAFKGKSAGDMKKEADSRQMFNSNLLEKPAPDGGKYLIDRTTGAIQYYDKHNNKRPIDKNSIPKNILKAAQHLKGKAAASAQQAKKESNEQAWVNSPLVKPKTFTPAETGVKVYIEPTSARIYANGKLVAIPNDYSRRKAIKMLKDFGVTDNFNAIFDAVHAARQGIIAANNRREVIDAENAKKQRQLRQEAVCDYMNEILGDTVLEAVIDDIYITLVEYKIDTQKLSDEDIQALESEGFTVNETDKYYEIYE